VSFELKTRGLSVGYLTDTECRLGTLVPVKGGAVKFRPSNTTLAVPVPMDAVFVSRHHAVAAMLKRGTPVEDPNSLSLDGLFTDEDGVPRVIEARFYLGFENLVDNSPVTTALSIVEKAKLITAARLGNQG
jgi:hypothetical protein